MSRNILFFFFLIGISCFISEIYASDSLQGGRRYECSRLSGKILVDGALNESAWQDAKWSDDFVDIEGVKKPLPRLRTRMKMLWDTNFLYIAGELEEPHLWATLTDRDAIIYRNNNFEVFIDPDGDGYNYYELEINAFGTEFDLFMNKPYNSGGQADIQWNFEGMISAVALYGSVNKTDDADSGWTVEIAIPWESLTSNDGTAPEPGDIWRMNFSRVEWDLEKNEDNYQKKTDAKTGKSLPENNWVWSAQGVINMHVPEEWGFVEFTEFDTTPKFWVWMGGRKRTDQGWDSVFMKLDDLGIRGILINSDTALLSWIIPKAENYNIEIHAWFWTMNRGEAKAEWLSVNRLGKSLAEERAYVDYYKFMCPALPEVQKHLISRMNDLAQVKGLKGIHMDYIRYVDAVLPIGLWDKYGLVQDHIMPEYDYGYHPYMMQLYENRFGIHPLELESPENDSSWLEFRLQQLNETVEMLEENVRSHDLKISSAVFPTPAMSRYMVRQDWGNWNLDYYFPMIYHSFYNESIEWIGRVVAEDRAALPANAKLFCGLYLPALKNGKDLTLAIQQALKNGADGVAFFSFDSLDEGMEEQVRGMGNGEWGMKNDGMME